VEQEDVQSALSYSHLGFMFVLTVGGMIFLGLKIDEWAGSSPWGVLLGFAAGFALGFYYLVVQVFKQSDEAEARGDGEAGGPGEDTK
jgi:F0F1-type ATP synthase assembly protein I